MCSGRLNCRLEGASFVPRKKKPFDVLIEGLCSGTIRGNWTPLELFIAGVRGWEACPRRLDDGKLVGHVT
jgi:hypothetical protein